jgi:hypothetical protein
VERVSERKVKECVLRLPAAGLSVRHVIAIRDGRRCRFCAWELFLAMGGIYMPTGQEGSLGLDSGKRDPFHMPLT